MKVEQIAQLTNNITKEITGVTGIMAEDLSNVVDIGKEIFENTDVDSYTKKLLNHIGKVIFVNRPYKGRVPSVLMDSWAYGSVLEKVRAELPEAVESATWELTDGKSYDQDVFHQPKVSMLLFNEKVTFDVELSVTDLQVRQSFSSAEQLNGFMDLIFTNVENAITLRLDALIMRLITNMIAQTLYSEAPGGAYETHTGAKAVNLLKLYNDKFNAAPDAVKLTPDTALYDLDFLRFSTSLMSEYVDRLSVANSLFNIGKTIKFTPDDRLHFILHSTFANKAKSYLQANTFNEQLNKLPNYETVPYWQGIGTDFSFANTSDIHVNIAEPGNKMATHEVVASGIVGVMFDTDTLGVANFDRRVTTHVNGKAEFVNYFYHQDAGYFNDLNENFVVFYIA